MPQIKKKGALFAVYADSPPPSSSHVSNTTKEGARVSPSKRGTKSSVMNEKKSKVLGVKSNVSSSSTTNGSRHILGLQSNSNTSSKPTSTVLTTKKPSTSVSTTSTTVKKRALLGDRSNLNENNVEDKENVFVMKNRSGNGNGNVGNAKVLVPLGEKLKVFHEEEPHKPTTNPTITTIVPSTTTTNPITKTKTNLTNNQINTKTNTNTNVIPLSQPLINLQNLSLTSDLTNSSSFSDENQITRRPTIQSTAYPIDNDPFFTKPNLRKPKPTSTSTTTIVAGTNKHSPPRVFTHNRSSSSRSKLSAFLLPSIPLKERERVSIQVKTKAKGKESENEWEEEDDNDADQEGDKENLPPVGEPSRPLLRNRGFGVDALGSDMTGLGLGMGMGMGMGRSGSGIITRQQDTVPNGFHTRSESEMAIFNKGWGQSQSVSSSTNNTNTNTRGSTVVRPHSRTNSTVMNGVGHGHARLSSTDQRLTPLKTRHRRGIPSSSSSASLRRAQEKERAAREREGAGEGGEQGLTGLGLDGVGFQGLGLGMGMGMGMTVLDNGSQGVEQGVNQAIRGEWTSSGGNGNGLSDVDEVFGGERRNGSQMNMNGWTKTVEGAWLAPPPPPAPKFRSGSGGKISGAVRRR